MKSAKSVLKIKLVLNLKFYEISNRCKKQWLQIGGDITCLNLAVFYVDATNIIILKKQKKKMLNCDSGDKKEKNGF